MQLNGLGDDAYTRDFDGKKYIRPRLFGGNFPEAIRSMGIGAVSLLAALGKWTERQQVLIDQAKSALEWMEKRPIYLVSDKGTQLQRFGHHLVDLALNGELYLVVKNLNRVSLIGIDDDKKFGNNNWKLFVTAFDHFVRFFTPSSFQNFLAFRATYPFEFFTLLNLYFMDKGKYEDRLIKSAVAYGRSLNTAAFLAAKQEDDEDKRKNRQGRGIQEYKHRTLLQLESIIQSAKTNQELIARLNSQVGRLTMKDIHPDAQDFIEAVVNEQVTALDARNLITAFMRLSNYKANTVSDSTEEHDEDNADESALNDE